ncbi:MAG: V-type ATP synthase subunit D [Candidatus Wallbacteria bacterium]|nr:V-type ATP synthase subunit D [Candidatus Wallbacteria bacterium]
MAKKASAKNTRMELQRLKKQLKMAVRGHKLLKEKRDGLMQEFLRIVRTIRELRRNLENELREIYSLFLNGYSFLPLEEKENVFEKPSVKLMVKTELGNVMGVKIPRFSMEGDVSFNGFWDKGRVSLNIDLSVLKLRKIMQDLIRLSQIEKASIMLAEEIESTRRRVNALEYVLIPDTKETIKFILMKISEMERSNISMLMKVKDIIRQEKA